MAGTTLRSHTTIKPIDTIRIKTFLDNVARATFKLGTGYFQTSSAGIYLLLITRAALYSNERYFQTTTNNNNNKSFDVNRYNLLQLNMPLKQQCTLAIERIEILLIEV